MSSYLRKVTPLLAAVLILASLASSALTIETFDGNLDINAVSPESHVAQVVKVLDAQGDQVNESVLLNASGNEFQYRYGDNWTDMTHLQRGYYYALFETGSSVSDIEYRIIDQSPGGDTTQETESLTTGQLDVDIETNYTGRYEAGETVSVEATVENRGEYYAVDVDGSGDVTDEDILITDNGGSGTFSKTSDPLLAGYPPVNGVSLSNTNPWSSGTHTVAMMDSNSGDGWDPGADLIIRDFNSGGTVSTAPDTAMNTGNDESIDTEAGQELNPVDSASADLHYVSADAGFDQGDEVVLDSDDDGRFTREPDDLIAGREPNPGENITYSDSIPGRMGIASYDENGGGQFDPGEDIIVFDRDNDSVFTGQPDTVMIGATPPEAAELVTGHVDAWNDGDPTDARVSDLETHDEDTSDGGWNGSEDAIWIEENDNNGYQSSGDTLVAGNPEEGQEPTQTDSLFDQWPNISGYDRNEGDTGFDPDVDAVIRDYNTGGTYSAQEDAIIAGSISSGSSFSSGSEFTSPDGFPGSWRLDVIETIDGGRWSSGQDTILRDHYGGGTYSAEADEVVNSGGSIDSPMGTELRQLSTAPSDDLMWSDLDSSDSYSSGDEIFRDLDEDEQYTDQADEHLAGLSLDIAGAGAQVQTTNLWQETPYDNTPVLFYDLVNPGQWDEDWDAIIHDADEDGVYTGQEDRIIEGDASEAENGDALIATDPPNTSTPDVHARITTGSNTTGPLQLGRTQQGVYTGEVQLPSVHDSRMVLQVNAETPISGLKGMESRVIRTRAQGIGFDTDTTSIDLDIDRKGNYSRQVVVENLLEDENTVDINVTEELENITESMDNQVSMEASGNATSDISFNIDELEDTEGEIIFTEVETDISQNVDVSVEAPSCQLRNTQLCVQNVEQLSTTTDQRENTSMELDLLNIGYRDSERQVTTDVSGNISDFISVTNSTSFTDTAQMNVEFSAMRPGNYSGTLSLETSDAVLDVPLELSANFEELETGISVTPGEIDLGVVPEGNDKTVENIMIENTGTTVIQNVTFSSSSFTLEQGSDAGVEEEESRNYTLTFSSLESVDGQVELVAHSDEESVSRTMDVSGSTVPPVTEMKSEISNQVSNLRRQATGSSTMSQLTEIETQMSSIQTSWDKGNYVEAQNKYQTAMSDLSAVEAQIQSSSQGTNGTGQDGSDPQTPDDSSSGGGGGILILLILLIIILGAGFVLYTSYYPEEGDPLYDVLGDRE